MAPNAPADITMASAVPRPFSNQLDTAREYAICAVPFPTTPSRKKIAYRCRSPHYCELVTFLRVKRPLSRVDC